MELRIIIHTRHFKFDDKKTFKSDDKKNTITTLVSQSFNPKKQNLSKFRNQKSKRAAGQSVRKPTGGVVDVEEDVNDIVALVVVENLSNFLLTQEKKNEHQNQIQIYVRRSLKRSRPCAIVLLISFST